MYFIFLSDGGSPKRRETRGNLPPPSPLDGYVEDHGMEGKGQM